MGQRGPLSQQARLNRRAQQSTDNLSEPQMPEGLSQAAQQEWARLTGLLRERGALDALDETGLNDYLVCWSRLRECEADIAERGTLVQGERTLVKNPSVQIARQYRDALVAWCREFGLTYAARQRVAMPQAKKEDPNDPWSRIKALPKIGSVSEGRK